MFRCQLCNTLQPPKTPAVQIVLETRERHYPHRPQQYFKTHYKGKPLTRKQKRNPKPEYFNDDPGGVGRETVRAIMVCPSCARRLRP